MLDGVFASVSGRLDRGAGDATDFRAVRADFVKSEAGCVFCALPSERIVAENPLAVAILDKFPVMPLHTLVIQCRHVTDYFDLHDSEVRAIHRLVLEVRRKIADRATDVAGFNIGVNIGQAAGQTISHAHVHVIPRRVGDVENPRGGVRGTVPGKADY